VATVHANRRVRSAPLAVTIPRCSAAAIGSVTARGSRNRRRSTGPGNSALVLQPVPAHRVLDRTHRRPQIHPVEQRPGQPTQIPPTRRRSARAISLVRRSARARISGQHQQTPRRVSNHPIPPSQPDLTILQRSAQRLQRSRPELRDLVKKQHLTVPWTASMYLDHASLAPLRAEIEQYRTELREVLDHSSTTTQRRGAFRVARCACRHR
jgi:hypothetical protein